MWPKRQWELHNIHNDRSPPASDELFPPSSSEPFRLKQPVRLHCNFRLITFEVGLGYETPRTRILRSSPRAIAENQTDNRLWLNLISKPCYL